MPKVESDLFYGAKILFLLETGLIKALFYWTFLNKFVQDEGFCKKKLTLQPIIMIDSGIDLL